jgi:hypothetical protein
MLPPMANQPIVPGNVPTREHHQFLLSLYQSILAGDEAIAALQAESGHYETLGPFFIAALPGTATTAMQLGYFTGATAVRLDAVEMHSMRAGRIVGARLITDEDRTAGTATARVRIGGTGTAFDGGNVQLNASNVSRNQRLVPWASGVTFNAGQRLGMEVVTSGWTPTTANLTGFLIVKYDAF